MYSIISPLDIYTHDRPSLTRPATPNPCTAFDEFKAAVQTLSNPPHHYCHTLVNLAMHCLHRKKTDTVTEGKNDCTCCQDGEAGRSSISLTTAAALFPNLPILFPSFPGTRQKLRAARRY